MKGKDLVVNIMIIEDALGVGYKIGIKVKKIFKRSSKNPCGILKSAIDLIISKNKIPTKVKEKIMTLHTPYAAAKIVNVWLSEDGINKKIPPQMMYQYT